MILRLLLFTKPYDDLSRYANLQTGYDNDNVEVERWEAPLLGLYEGALISFVLTIPPIIL